MIANNDPTRAPAIIFPSKPAPLDAKRKKIEVRLGLITEMLACTQSDKNQVYPAKTITRGDVV